MPETIGYNRNAKIRANLSREMEEKLTSAYSRLELGQSYRQKQREQIWNDNYNMYMGSTWDYNPDDPTADLVSVNVAFSTLATIVPFVADEDPQFLVYPLSGDASQEAGVLLTSYLNRLWRSSDVRGQTHLADGVFDNLLYGDGWLQVGYDIRTQEIYDSFGNEVQNRVEIAHFMVERVNPWDIWIDPYSDGLHNARWLCRRYILPRRELESDKRYKVTKNTEWESGAIETNNLSPEDRSRLDDVDTADWVTIYEFYDLIERYMIAFTPGGGQAVRYIEHISCPIIQIANSRIPNSPYHMSDLEQISALQHELNKTRSQMITHRRRNVGKWVIRQHALNDDAEEAMKSSRVNEVIPIEAPEPLDYLIQYIAPQPISQDAYALDDRIRADVNELTGVNEYLRGVPQDISRTATEASIIEGATNIRTRHKLLQVERAARDLGQLLLDIVRDVLPLTDYEEVRQFVTGREAERLNRATGQTDIDTDVVFTPTPELFMGRYEVEVERGSTELRNPQIKAQKLNQVVQIMLGAVPLLMQMGVPFNIQRLLELWLEAEGIEDVDALFESDEQQALMQQLMLLQQANGAMGAEGGVASPDGFGGGGRTAPGEPRAETTNPPADFIDATNSGILPST